MELPELNTMLTFFCDKVHTSEQKERLGTGLTYLHHLDSGIWDKGIIYKYAAPALTRFIQNNFHNEVPVEDMVDFLIEEITYELDPSSTTIQTILESGRKLVYNPLFGIDEEANFLTEVLLSAAMRSNSFFEKITAE